MSDYTYVSEDEVRAVCKALGLRDWTQLDDARVEMKEAEIIRNIVGGETSDIPLESFQLGLQIELEHGLIHDDANVTNNHPVLTGRIVLAHLKEGLDYYDRLLCMELEMELLAAITAKHMARVGVKRRQLAEARARLEAAIAARLD